MAFLDVFRSQLTSYTYLTQVHKYVSKMRGNLNDPLVKVRLQQHNPIENANAELLLEKREVFYRQICFVCPSFLFLTLYFPFFFFLSDAAFSLPLPLSFYLYHISCFLSSFSLSSLFFMLTSSFSSGLFPLWLHDVTVIKACL